MSVPAYTDQDLYGASRKPQSSDIAQGNLGDCYLLSSLGAVAAHQPETIENAIHYNADNGSFTVTMHNPDHPNAGPVQIEVTQADLRVDKGIGVDSNGYWNQSGNPPLWPEVMESAYAKMMADKAKLPETMQGDLHHIEAGYPSNAIYAITGQHDQTIPASSLGNLDRAYDQLHQAVQDGRPMILSTMPMKDMPNDGLVKGTWNEADPSKNSGHAYILEGVSKDAHGDVMLTLRNPWGNNNDRGQGVTSADATVTVSLKQIIDNGHLESIDIGPAATRQQEQTKGQTQQHNGSQQKDGPAPGISSGCPYVDKLMESMGDPKAFDQALKELGASPYADAFRAESHAANVQLQNQQLQHQVTQQQTQIQQLQQQPVVQQGPMR